MARFEKIIVPLLSNSIKPEDFTESSGFIETYTSDPDRPCGDNEFFILFDDNIRSEQSIDRARRYNTCRYLKRTYTKYISGNPYIVYSFWIDHTIKHLYKGTFTLDANQKLQIAQFWGDSDITQDILTNTIIQSCIEHPMPLADYRTTIAEKQLKGVAQKYVTPFFYFYLIIEHNLVRLQ